MSEIRVKDDNGNKKSQDNYDNNINMENNNAENNDGNNEKESDECNNIEINNKSIRNQNNENNNIKNQENNNYNDIVMENNEEKIIDKIYSIYQKKKIKDKEKLNNLVKELTTEESNVLEKEIDEKSEDMVHAV
ncbi:hypothetical protein RhiirA4_419543 [Rhizophagus irregularis]|uniref:Uncharacterized protein n=1 Tax=Rhizophagus irregularis TaxID=588596 RepID=A0A2I1GEL0_9GLOM|nr:hypothetical protein RhiirA4_419543 [Rhizophagus irregularis]